MLENLVCCAFNLNPEISTPAAHGRLKCAKNNLMQRVRLNNARSSKQNNIIILYNMQKKTSNARDEITRCSEKRAIHACLYMRVIYDILYSKMSFSVKHFHL